MEVKFPETGPVSRARSEDTGAMSLLVALDGGTNSEDCGRAEVEGAEPVHAEFRWDDEVLAVTRARKGLSRRASLVALTRGGFFCVHEKTHRGLPRACGAG